MHAVCSIEEFRGNYGMFLIGGKVGGGNRANGHLVGKNHEADSYHKKVSYFVFA